MIVEDFSIALRKNEPGNIGRFAAIRLCGERQIIYGTVMDQFAGTDRPKRIRIQAGDPGKMGDVVQPHEYEFLWFGDEEED